MNIIYISQNNCALLNNFQTSLSFVVCVSFSISLLGTKEIENQRDLDVFLKFNRQDIDNTGNILFAWVFFTVV